MKPRGSLPCLAVATLFAVGTPADRTVEAAPEAEEIRIDHAGVGCVVAGRYPSFEARFDPADRVREARLRFRPEGGRDWSHYVGPLAAVNRRKASRALVPWPIRTDPGRPG